jgi:hypothetical protein
MTGDSGPQSWTIRASRRFIMNKLYRMAQKELIYSVEGRKGLYYVPKVRQPPAAFDTDLDDDVPF